MFSYSSFKRREISAPKADKASDQKLSRYCRKSSNPSLLIEYRRLLPRGSTLTNLANSSTFRCCDTAGLLTGSNRTRLIEVQLSPGMEIEAGDEVRLSLAPAHLLRAAVFAYGMPLGGIVIAVGIASILNKALDDHLAIALAISGLVIGGLLGRHFLNQDVCLKNLIPTVSERNA